MGKTITLPLGLLKVDADTLGTWTASGANWIVTVLGLKEAYIYAAGGIDPGSIYKLKETCLLSSINKWAAFKPNRGGSSHASGMNVESEEFAYQKPGDTHGYQLDHFAGYHHAAPTPVAHTPSNISFIWTGDRVLQDYFIIVGLPEFDIREIQSLTHMTIRAYNADGATTAFDEEATTTLVDWDIELRSVGGTFKYKTADSSSYDVHIEVWFGNVLDDKIVKHPSYGFTITAGKVATPVITVLDYFEKEVLYYLDLGPLSGIDPIDEDVTFSVKCYYDSGDGPVQLTGGSYLLRWYSENKNGSISITPGSGYVNSVLSGANYEYKNYIVALQPATRT